MKEKTVLDLLADHAEVLNRIDDITVFDVETWLARYPLKVATKESLLPLLQLAQLVKYVLVPVQPSIFFKRELKQQLNQTSSPSAARSAGLPRRRFVWVGAAVIGSALSVAGLWFWFGHRFSRSLSESSHPMGTAI